MPGTTRHSKSVRAAAPEPDAAAPRHQPSAALLAQQQAEIPRHLTALEEAKHTGDPVEIRSAADKLDRTKAVLTVSLRFGGGAFDETNKATAKHSIALLETTIVEARALADRLDSATQLFSQLPSGPRPDSPETTRTQARHDSPIGLCDDPVMQRSDSQACGLDPVQRSASRDDAEGLVGKVATDWKDAVMDVYQDEKLRPLLEDNGLNPVAAILLDVFTGFVASTVTPHVFSKLDAKATAKVSAEAVLTSKDRTNELVGLGKKLADKGSAIAMRGDAHAGATDLVAEIDEQADTWKLRTTQALRQLPDPDLVALVAGLRRSRPSQAHFKQRIQALVNAFHKVDRVGRFSPLGPSVQLAWVTFPSAPARLAMVRPVVRAGGEPVPGELLTTMVKLARGHRYVFEGWVDARVMGTALARQQLIGRLPDDSDGWETRPSSSDWLGHEDITMFDGKDAAQ